MQSKYLLLIFGILAVFSLIPAVHAATPSIGLEVTYPEDNLSVNQNRFFHVTANVSCFTSDCGDINVSLDPYPAECSSYTAVDWDANSIYQPYTTGDCSSGLTPGWYRMTGTYKAIPTQRSYIDMICNTHAPGFLDFSYPTAPGATTAGNICYHWNGNTCEWYSAGIQVTNCAGYYVYYLTPSPVCTLHPCTTDAIAPPPQDKFGLVNETPGAIPFYTNQSNPRTISLNTNQSQLVTFWVNATGAPWDYQFFAYANLTADPTINNQTPNWTVSIYPQPQVEFVDLPSSVTTPDPSVNVTINLSTEYFLGAPESVDLDSLWWNDGTSNHSYSAPVNHTFSVGSYLLTAYANDTEGNVYSSSETLDIGPVACGDSVSDDVVMTSNLDCSSYSGNALVVDSDNILIDCDGYSISGSGSYTGINLNSRTNVTIKNCSISNFYDGIYMGYTDGSHILSNNMSDCYYGLNMYYSDFNDIMYNNFLDNEYGFYLYQSDSNMIGRNNANETGTMNFGGSCPFLFLGNGDGYDYYTDLAGESLGGSKAETPLYEAGMYELGNFESKDGIYKMKIREVIPESDFVDELKLAIVDVPEGYGVLNQWHNTYSDNVAPPKGFMTIKDPKAPVSAVDKYGNDVLEEVSGKDGVPLPMQGNEPNSVIVDFGAIDNPQYAKLVITGWAAYGTDAESPYQKNLIIEAMDADGEWAEAKAFGKFTGDSRTFVFDIADILKANDTRMRISAAFSRTNTNILDQVLLDDSEPVDIEVTYVDPSVADLQWGGSTGVDYGNTEHRHIVTDEQLPDVERYFMYGNFTKYGDVGPLLEDADDMFAVMRHGDELSLEFQDIAPAPGKDRHAFLLADVMYSIKYTTSRFVSDSIEPMPFHGMSEYPYGDNESYPDDAEHRAYRSEWNTRSYEAPVKYGGSLPYSYNNTVFENVIIGDMYATGLYLYNEEETKLLYNNISGVEVGIDLYDSYATEVTGNRVFSEGGRALIIHQDSSDSIVEDNVFYSDSSEWCNFDGCGAVYLGRTEGNTLERNNLTGISGNGLVLGYSDWNDFTDNIIVATDGEYAIYMWDSSDNSFLHNTLMSDYWVYDNGGDNSYNDEDSGNRYFTEDGTPAVAIFNITDDDSNGWADSGSDIPFSCDTVGECDSAYSFWSGDGEDWHPFVSEVVPESGGDDDSSPRTLSLGLESTCDGNIVTVEGAGDEAHVVVKDSGGNVVAAGQTSGDGFTFSGCGLEGLVIKATQSGYLPGTLLGVDTVSCASCGQNMTGCALDSDCLSSQRCTSGVCVNVPCECGAYENRQCMPYACCSDSQCAADELCQNHLCAKKPAFECTSDAQCPATKYCDKPTGAAGGSCKDVTGQCGQVVNHAFVPYGYECGTETGCPTCPSGSSCESHVCMAKNDLSCPSTGIVGDRKTCAATENNQPCSLCDFVYTDPTGKNFIGRTDENGNFDLPLNMQGTYRVALLKDGAVVKVIEVKAFPQAQPQEPQKPAATGPDMGMVLMLLFLMLLVVLGIVYWRSRGQKKK
jgi:parallel beta-helix repeat protein